MAIKLPTNTLKSQLWLQKGDWMHQWDKLERKIKEHPFNHAIEVVFPGVDQLPVQLSSLPQPTYYTARLPLRHFIQPDIIQQYLQLNEGELTALSVGRRIDIDNIFAVLPTGKLLMCVDKDTYEQLGLQGKPSRYEKIHRYLVDVDLTASCFKPGKPNYDRVKWSLSEQLNLEVDFILSWSSKDPSSEALFLEDFKATKQSCEIDQELFKDFSLPTIKGDHPHGDSVVCCSVEEFHTWLGAVSCGILNTYEESAPDDYVSTFILSEPHSRCKRGSRMRWTGMISSRYISDLLKSVRQCLTSPSHGPVPPWIAIHIWGFEDSPISWRTCEHGYFLSGDNHVTVVLFNSGQYWCMSTFGTYDYIQ